MGDTGSLSLGGSLGAVGIITKHEIVYFTGGLCFRGSVSHGSGNSLNLQEKEYLKWLQYIIILKKRLARVCCSHKILDYFNNFGHDWFGYT